MLSAYRSGVLRGRVPCFLSILNLHTSARKTSSAAEILWTAGRRTKRYTRLGLLQVRVIPVQNANQQISLMGPLVNAMRLSRVGDHFRRDTKHLKRVVEFQSLARRDARVGFAVKDQRRRFRVFHEAHRRMSLIELPVLFRKAVSVFTPIVDMPRASSWKPGEPVLPVDRFIDEAMRRFPGTELVFFTYGTEEEHGSITVLLSRDRRIPLEVGEISCTSNLPLPRF